MPEWIVRFRAAADLTTTSFSPRLDFSEMRKTLLRSAAVIILAGMLGGQITELFDHWDHTAQTGRDVDYTVVVVAACLGVVFAIGRKFVCAALRLLVTLRPPASIGQMVSAFRMISAEPLATGPPTSNLSPLRI